MEKEIPDLVEVIAKHEENDDVLEERPSATPPEDVMQTLEQVLSIPASEKGIPRPEEEFIKEVFPHVGEEAPSALAEANCVPEGSLTGSQVMHGRDEVMRAADEEIDQPEEVMT